MNINPFTFNDNDFDYITLMAGDDILINNTLPYAKALINNTKVNRNVDIRTISTKSPIKRGDYINWNGNNWLIISEVADKRFTYYKGIMQKCNFTIKFNFQGFIKEYPCILSSQYYSITDNKFFNVPEEKLLLTIPYTSDIEIDQRFIKLNRAYKVVGNDFTQQGLSVLTCENTSIDTLADDVENEIADYYTYQMTLSILNGAESYNLEPNDTLQLSTEVKSNDNVIEGQIGYRSSDNTIATINADGVVTAVGEGECIIEAYLQDMPYICDKITIKINDEENITYDITGTTFRISMTSSATFTAEKYIDGVLQQNSQFDFTIEGDTPEDAYTLTILNDQQCQIKCHKYVYYITLVATDREDPTKQIRSEEIMLKALF